MRPAVYASVVRNRKQSARRARGPHEFSMRRMILMLFIGSLLVIFGLIVTIVGIVNGGDIDDVQGDRVLYKVIGPAGLACGIGLVAAGGIYYCCWGYRPGSRSRHTSTCSVPTVSQATNQSAYSSVRSQSSPQHCKSNSFSQKSSQCNSPPPYQVTCTSSSHRSRTSSRSSHNSNDVGSSYLPHHHRCSSCSSSQQNYSYHNKNDNNPAVYSKADESLPEDAIAGSFDVKLEMTEGV